MNLLKKYPNDFLEIIFGKINNEFLDEIPRGIVIGNPLRISWRKSPEKFLMEIPGQIFLKNTLRDSWRKSPEKFLEDIQEGIPGGYPVRHIGGTLIEYLENLLEIFEGGLC